MPTIEVQALDTLFFRDGKPFEMGDDNWAEGIFPPPPSVIYGALRSAYFAQHPEVMEKWKTDQDPTKDLRITGYYLKYGDKIYLPAPLDLVLNKNYDDEHLFPLRLMDVESKKVAHNYGLKYIPYFDGEAITPKGYYLRDGDLKKYLQNKIDVNNGLISTNIQKMIFNEPKIGVALNNETGSSTKGKLYRVGLNRFGEEFDKDWMEFKKLSFIIEFEGLVLKEQEGLLKLGAENKVANYSVFNKEIKNFRLENAEKSNYFKIVFLTDTCSEKGNLLELKNNLKIIAAFVGNYISIGGWDIKEKEPKKLYKAIPAGSVFYIKSEEEISIFDLYDLLGFSLSDVRKNKGFGLYVITNLKLEI